MATARPCRCRRCTCRSARLGYAEGPGYQVVTLPYRGGKLAFSVIVPATVDTLRTKGIAAVLDEVRPASVTLAMPGSPHGRASTCPRHCGRRGMSDAFSDDGGGLQRHHRRHRAAHRLGAAQDLRASGREGHRSGGRHGRRRAGHVGARSGAPSPSTDRSSSSSPTRRPAHTLFLGRISDPQWKARVSPWRAARTTIGCAGPARAPATRRGGRSRRACPCCQVGTPSATGASPCGLWSPTPCQRDSGSTMKRALPITLSMGTTPRRPPPPWKRESLRVVAVVAHDPERALGHDAPGRTAACASGLPFCQ